MFTKYEVCTIIQLVISTNQQHFFSIQYMIINGKYYAQTIGENIIYITFVSISFKNSCWYFVLTAYTLLRVLLTVSSSSSFCSPISKLINSFIIFWNVQNEFKLHVQLITSFHDTDFKYYSFSTFYKKEKKHLSSTSTQR